MYLVDDIVKFPVTDTNDLRNTFLSLITDVQGRTLTAKHISTVARVMLSFYDAVGM